MGAFRRIGREDRRHPFFGEILYFFFKRILSCINNSFYITSRCPGRTFLNFVDSSRLFFEQWRFIQSKEPTTRGEEERGRGGGVSATLEILGWSYLHSWGAGNSSPYSPAILDYASIIPALLRYSTNCEPETPVYSYHGSILYKPNISSFYKRRKVDFTVGNIYFFVTNISEGRAFLLQALTASFV